MKYLAGCAAGLTLSGLLCGSVFAQTILETKGGAFEDLIVVDREALAVKISCDDEDLSDGYTWELTFDNKSKETDFAISFSETAINGVMCGTDEWGLSGWTVKAGQQQTAGLSWNSEDLGKSGIDEVSSVAFLLKAYDDKKLTETATGYVDDIFLIKIKENEEEASTEAADHEAETSEQETGPGEEETESLEEETETGTVVPYPVLDNDRFKMNILSFGEDEEGYPLWDMEAENNTDDLIRFTVGNTVLNGWGIEPFWAQTVMPHAKACFELSWWDLEAKPEDISPVKKASFDLYVWKEKIAWNTEWKLSDTFPVKIDLTEQEEDETEAEEDVLVLYEGGDAGIGVSDLSVDIGEEYGEVGLFLENTGSVPIKFQIDKARIDENKVKINWDLTLPASSRKNSTVYLDFQNIDEESEPEVLELHFTVWARKEKQLDKTFRINIKDRTLIVNEEEQTEDLEGDLTEDASGQDSSGGEETGSSGDETTAGQEMSEEPHYNDQYEDEKTIRNLKNGLRAAGYETDSEPKPTGKLREQIADYRSRNKIGEGSDIDDELLFSLGVADSETYRQVQEALNAAGFDCGAADGLAGKKTRAAIENFRKTYRLASGDGIDEELLDLLEIHKK